MDDTQLRELVAEEVGKTHGNKEFVRQIAEGGQDDGPYMQAAFAVRNWFLKEMMPPENGIDE